MPRAVDGRKICSVCRIEKFVEEFSLTCKAVDGRQCQCKKCCSAYRLAHKKEYVERDARHYSANQDRVKKRARDYHWANRDSVLAKMKERDPKRKADQDAKYRRTHAEQIKAQKRRQSKANRAKITAKDLARRNSDPLVRFKHNIRGLIQRSLRGHGFRKDTKTAQILGCTAEEARVRIGWFPGCETHHVVPMETARTQEDAIRLNHHTNLIALTVEAHAEIHRKMREAVKVAQLVAEKL